MKVTLEHGKTLFSAKNQRIFCVNMLPGSERSQASVETAVMTGRRRNNHMRFCLLFLASLLQCAAPLADGGSPPADPVAYPNATIVIHNVRFTILTDRLIRIERRRSDCFQDCQTISFLNRNLPVPNFTVNYAETVTIATDFVTIRYKPSEAFTADNLQISGRLDDSNTLWKYKYGDVDPHNLLGTIRTLDGLNVVDLNCTRHPESAHCEYGLISRTGYSIVNDTTNWCIKTWWDGPNDSLEDFYIFGHGHDYKAALSDYVQVGGRIPLLPKYSLGIWYSRWYDYTPQDIHNQVRFYEQYSLPLDVFVLDMNWHSKHDWTGYSWDTRLYQANEDALAYLKSRNLAVTLNLHDASGIKPYETQYKALCDILGLDATKNKTIDFTIINQTVSEAIDDVVLHPLQEQGVDFWWIDWQQGEKGPGGAVGGKMNPTIWTAHTRSTQPTRLHEDRRTLVLARWGGLGAHRYPVHFSGDVETMSWETLAYQMYFSMTGVNVGAVWSHDAHAPINDPELYVRFVQWSAFSGITRAHERGASAGDCVKANHERVCTVVEPWKVPYKFAQANYEALRTRGRLLPYLYTASHRAHMTGLWFTTPMYYEWPELDGAYETSALKPDDTSEIGPQYLFGEDLWVAPVVKPVGKKDGLSRATLWIPPGIWVGYDGGHVLTGSMDGSTYIPVTVDLSDVPLFARAGAVIPTRPVRTGNTIGLANKPYEELIWTIYFAKGVPRSGSGYVYDDDGNTLAHVRGDCAITTTEYNILKQVNSERITIDVSITTESNNFVPPRRANTIRITNTLPPERVTYNAKNIPWSRFGGKATWSYDSHAMAVVVELPALSTTQEIGLIVETRTSKTVDGIGFKIARAQAAKAALDEARITPGSQTGDAGTAGALLRVASMGTLLEYLAGHSLPLFEQHIGQFSALFEEARREVAAMTSSAATQRGLRDERLEMDPEIQYRISRALALLDTAH